MLAELAVKNFALIEELSLSFGPGFNALTGETGAGKSIIVGAINLILGGRASSDLIRQGADEAEVQSLFLPPSAEGFQGRLEDLGLAGAGEVLIRRVLSRTGRNRVYINGAPATLAQLASLGRDLVAVSGQHEHQQLLDPDRQLLFLDQFGGLEDMRSQMSRAHEEMTGLMIRAGALESRIREAREKTDLFEFQVQEIRAANLTPGEDLDLESERRLARNAEKIFSLVKQGFDRLYGEAGAVIEILDAVRADLERAAGLDERLNQTAAQVREAFHQLDDAAHVLRDHLDRLIFDPARLEEIEDRLAQINRLKRKYGPALEDVLGFGRKAAGHLEHLGDMEEDLARLGTEVEAARQRTRDLAGELSARRRAAAVEMSAAMARELGSLGMPRLEFDLRFEPVPEGAEPGPSGYDEVEYLISPNPGEALMPLARIASGGELSRSTLGLKCLLAGQDMVQTMIFDEVDAGIGGAVAEVVGRKLKELSGWHQVMCITHLPQIAAFAGHHHLVYKEVRGRRTVTDIRPLSKEEKVQEIARMLSGAEPTAKTRAAAREMIARADD